MTDGTAGGASATEYFTGRSWGLDSPFFQPWSLFWFSLPLAGVPGKTG